MQKRSFTHWTFTHMDPIAKPFRVSVKLDDARVELAIDPSDTESVQAARAQLREKSPFMGEMLEPLADNFGQATWQHTSKKPAP